MGIKGRAILIFGGLILFFGYIKFIVPSYPEISSNASLEEVKKKIDNIMRIEARNISFENLDGPTRGGIPVKNLKAVQNFINKLKHCGDNKNCLIKEYNTYMDKWVSNTLRKKTKAIYMIKKYGVAGELINDNFGVFY